MPDPRFDLDKLNLVPKGWSWRPGQRELAEAIAASPKKVVMLEAECGAGKSLIPIAAATALGKRSIVLIQTIQLQEQYLRDIRGLTMMAGRSHSTCNLTMMNADTAPCTSGVKCGLKGSWSRETSLPIGMPECNYFKRKAASALSPVSIQNYAYWLNETRTYSPFSKVPWIICDEAHELDQILMAVATISFKWREIAVTGIEKPDRATLLNRDAFIVWAKENRNAAAVHLFKTKARARAAGLQLPGDEYDEMAPTGARPNPGDMNITRILHDLKSAMRIDAAFSEAASIQIFNEWVVQEQHDGLDLKPIFGKYGFQRILRSATEKVVLMSAFLGAKMLIQTLGLNEDDVEIITAPKVYDRTKSRIYYCPTARMKYDVSDNSLNYTAGIVNAFASGFNAKGLVHVPSVSLRDKIIARTPNPTRGRFVAYDGKDAKISRYPSKETAIRQFVDGDGPLVLIGQSISTGLDLPHVPKFNIIVKVAFPPINDPAIAARKKVDPYFYPYQTICQLVQAAGRAKRAHDHDAYTIILDEQFSWFWARYKEYFPAWFRDNLVMNGWEAWKKIKEQRHAIGIRNGVLIQ